MFVRLSIRREYWRFIRVHAPGIGEEERKKVLGELNQYITACEDKKKVIVTGDMNALVGVGDTVVDGVTWSNMDE